MIKVQCYENTLVAHKAGEVWRLTILIQGRVPVGLGRFDTKDEIDKAMAVLYGAIVDARVNGYNDAQGSTR